MIQVDGISKRYGAVLAADQVRFSAADGQVTALLGPNGAGKSTTLRILSTVIAPSTGDALVDGHSVRTDPMEVRRLIGVLPHRAGLYERLSARENIRYYGQLQGLDQQTLARRESDLIDLLDMAEFANRRVAGFSQGQRIKVALARALIHDPKHVLLDEPTSGLDVMATRSLRDIIGTLKRQGRCVLFSSHIMQEVANVCDQIVIIGGGQVRFEGTQAALTERTGEPDLEEAFLRLLDTTA